MGRAIGFFLALLLLGSSPFAEARPFDFVVKWRIDADPQNNPLFLAKGVIGFVEGPYSPNPNVRVIGLDAAAVRLKWTISLSNHSSVMLSSTDGKLFFALYMDSDLARTNYEKSNRIEAIDPLTGHIVWSVSQSGESTLPLVMGNLVVSYTPKAGELRAYNATTGYLEWWLDYNVIQEFDWTNAAYGQGLIFHHGYPSLVAYRASSGDVKWSRDFSGSGMCTSYMDGMVFFEEIWPSESKAVGVVHLIAVNASDGTTVWNKSIGYIGYQGGTQDIIQACPALEDGRIFLLSNKAYRQANPDILALNGDDGKELWRRSFQCSPGPCSVTVTEVFEREDSAVDSLLFASVSGTLYGLIVNSGNVAWKYSFPRDSWVVPKKYSDGVLYVWFSGNGSTELIAFESLAELSSGGATFTPAVLLSLFLLPVVQFSSSETRVLRKLCHP